MSIPKKQLNLIPGLDKYKCTSFAPASFNFFTILEAVVPLTKESSITAIDLSFITDFMGFNFITSTRLNIASSKRECLAFASDGIKLGIGQDLMTRIDERNDKGYATQVYVCMSIGATRMEEDKVVSVQAHEA